MTQAFLVRPSSSRRKVWTTTTDQRRRNDCGAPSTVCGSSAPQLLSSTCLHAQEKENQQDDASFDRLNVPLILQVTAALSLLASAGTLWSEATVYQTGCGPLLLPDVLERICYQAVICVAGVAWFIRIVFRQGLADFLVQQGMMLVNDESTTTTSRVLEGLAEAAAYLAVVCALVVLGNQIENNVHMDGLSGVDIAACQARRDFFLQQ